MDTAIRDPGSMNSYQSLRGPAAQVELKDEDYLIVYRPREGGSFSSVDIDFSQHIIRIYDDRPWKVNSIDKNSRHINPIVVEQE